MHRPWVRRLTLPLWGVWLALAVTEQPMSFDCPMQRGMTGHVSAIMPGMPGMHPSQGGSSRPAGTPGCCGCLHDCSTTAATTLPASNDAVAFDVDAPERRTTDQPIVTARVDRVDLALPCATAPPLVALL